MVTTDVRSIVGVRVPVTMTTPTHEHTGRLLVGERVFTQRVVGRVMENAGRGAICAKVDAGQGLTRVYDPHLPGLNRVVRVGRMGGHSTDRS